MIRTPRETTIEAISARYARYAAHPINTIIHPSDGMFGHGMSGALEHYLRVGRDAIDVIAGAMVAAGRSNVASVLDLPCGFGRVARQLRAFFPDAALFAGDIDPEMVSFVRNTFDAKPLEFDPAFARPSSHGFDLIWVGSLLTHLPPDITVSALRWFCSSLAPGGVLVATTLGRSHELAGRHPDMPLDRWNDMIAGFVSPGIGFSPDNPAAPHIGHTMIRPSWLARHVEDEHGVRLVSLHEGGWVGSQDVLVLQRQTASG